MAKNTITLIELFGEFKFNLLMEEIKFWENCDLGFDSLEETLNLNCITIIDDHDEEEGVYN